MIQQKQKDWQCRAQSSSELHSDGLPLVRACTVSLQCNTLVAIRRPRLFCKTQEYTSPETQEYTLPENHENAPLIIKF